MTSQERHVTPAEQCFYRSWANREVLNVNRVNVGWGVLAVGKSPQRPRSHRYKIEIELLFSVRLTELKYRSLSVSDPRRVSCGFGGREFWAAGLIIPRGFAYCGLSLRHETKRIWLWRSFSPAFIPSSGDVLTCCSKLRRRFMNWTCVGRGHPCLKERRERPDADVLEVELHDIFMAVLTVNNINMFTMGPRAPSPLFPHCSPVLFCFFLTHMHSGGEKKMTSPQLTIHCTSIGLNGAAQQKVT